MAGVCDFSSLPPELQGMIFGLVSDVNKQWNTGVAGILWAYTNIDLIDLKPVHDLLAVRSGGMLDSVRNLEIDARSFENESPSLLDYHEHKVKKSIKSLNFLVLLMSLPNRCLLSFRCASYQLPRDALGILLKYQSRLRELVVNLDGNETYGLHGPRYVRGKLKELQSLSILKYGGKNSDRFYKHLPVWFQQAPQLKSLQIIHIASDSIGHWIVPTGARPLSLETLSLTMVDFNNFEGSTTCFATGLPHLHTLELILCSGTSLILQSFAKELERTGNKYLRSLVLRDFMKEPLCMALAELFRATGESLTKLEMISCGKENPPAMEIIGPSAKTLQELRWMCVKSATMTESDAAYIAANCVSLERLVVSFNGLDQAVSGLDVMEPFDLSKSGACTVMLTALARLPTLNQLSLLVEMLSNADEYHTRERQWRYAQVAEQVLQLFAKHSSKLELLDFGSLRGPSDNVNADGHTWPFYSYRAGTTTATIAGRQHFVKTTAVPVPVPDGCTHLMA